MFFAEAIPLSLMFFKEAIPLSFIFTKELFKSVPRIFEISLFKFLFALFILLIAYCFSFFIVVSNTLGNIFWLLFDDPIFGLNVIFSTPFSMTFLYFFVSSRNFSGIYSLINPIFFAIILKNALVFNKF